jgi:hypothetical protein
MRIKAGNGDARRGHSTTAQKIFQEQTDANNLILPESAGYLMQRKMRGDQRHGQLATRKQHREILHAAPVGKELGLPWKLKTDLVHPRFVNWPGHDSLNFTAESKSGAFFEGVESRVSRLGSGLA